MICIWEIFTCWILAQSIYDMAKFQRIFERIPKNIACFFNSIYFVFMWTMELTLEKNEFY